MMNTHAYEHTQTISRTHAVGYSLWLWFVNVGREEGGAGEEDKEEWAALVVNLDCFLQVGVTTSLWSFVEMIQP